MPRADSPQCKNALKNFTYFVVFPLNSTALYHRTSLVEYRDGE